MKLLSTLLVLFPLLGFLFNILTFKRVKSEKIIGTISSIAVFLSFLISVYLFFFILSINNNEKTINIDIFNWILTGDLSINYSFVIDPLSVVMLLVVTGISFLIHLYSIGYMHGDKDFNLFFSYLNLFVFAMLNLILADNLVVVFLGWEGVGLCSYLLIGFWYEKKYTGDAAKKAFIVNRIGDFGYMIAVFLIFLNFNTLKISEFLSKLSGFDFNNILLTSIALLLFLAATGKSAQIPLYVWLPDAMAGPTPVSALIHAATMVTAGVYLLCRTSLLYSMSSTASNVVLLVGIATALFSAIIALKQNDIKKILAYSTVSQLGFMFIAIGSFSYVAAIFHLITHAFFKALMFLGSGSVIHSLHEEQDIRNMGGLKNHMKITFFTFLIGALAISGIPIFSGFFSKDEILYNLYTNSGIFLYLIVLVIAGFTSFYIFRLTILTFFGKQRNNIIPHESPLIMTIPLIILAFFSFIGGFIGLPHFTHIDHFLGNWLNPVFSKTKMFLASHSAEIFHSSFIEILLMALSVLVSVAAILFAFRKYSKVESFREEKGLGKIIENKFFVDELYDKAIINPLKKTSEVFLWNFIDIKIIDGFLNSLSNYILKLSIEWKKIQTGIIQDYATIALSGIVLIILYLIFY